MTHRTNAMSAIARRLFRACCVALSVAAAATASGCSYELQGKVVEGFGAVAIGRGDDPEASKSGVPGATIELVRDAGTMNRTVAARATADGNGRFTLDVQSFGAGWMEEAWVLRVRRSGFQTIEDEVQLPREPKGRLVVVSMARGRSAPFREPESTRTLIDEARAFEPGIGDTRR
jgi:hypothetical protein